uniref:Ig-like domain-containing protein n=1 Tax=Oncorhynchus mykiss TaxID=8022 RepID=A0A8L0DUP1_ONCMY
MFHRVHLIGRVIFSLCESERERERERVIPLLEFQCYDWGESGDGKGWLPCPLFSHPTVYNYSSAQAAGLNLVWYHVAAGQDLEQPIDFHHPDQRLSKERESLWLQSTTTQDTSQYICMLRQAGHQCNVMEHYQGLYHCVVTYETKGRAINFTRGVNVTAVCKTLIAMVTVAGSEVNLTCTVLLPYLEGPRKTWWTIDGKTVEQLADRRISNTSREYNCSGCNHRGVATLGTPQSILGCGLCVTLFLMLMLFVVYHIFWLELLLLYRSWFGTDEQCTGGTPSVQTALEEQFVLLTLHRVLENELGYTVGIFDRDSLPGGREYGRTPPPCLDRMV